MEAPGGTSAIFQATDFICQTGKAPPPSFPEVEGLAERHIVRQCGAGKDGGREHGMSSRPRPWRVGEEPCVLIAPWVQGS